MQQPIEIHMKLTTDEKEKSIIERLSSASLHLINITGALVIIGTIIGFSLYYLYFDYYNLAIPSHIESSTMLEIAILSIVIVIFFILLLFIFPITLKDTLEKDDIELRKKQKKFILYCFIISNLLVIICSYTIDLSQFNHFANTIAILFTVILIVISFKKQEYYKLFSVFLTIWLTLLIYIVILESLIIFSRTSSLNILLYVIYLLVIYLVYWQEVPKKIISFSIAIITLVLLCGFFYINHIENPIIVKPFEFLGLGHRPITLHIKPTAWDEINKCYPPNEIKKLNTINDQNVTIISNIGDELIVHTDHNLTGIHIPKDYIYKTIY